jgi:hypothetical protein
VDPLLLGADRLEEALRLRPLEDLARRRVDVAVAPSISDSSRKPRPTSDSVSRRFAFVSAFITALASASPDRPLIVTTPVASSSRPGLVAAAGVDRQQPELVVLLARIVVTLTPLIFRSWSVASFRAYIVSLPLR